MYPSPFEYHRASSVQDALTLLADAGGFVFHPLDGLLPLPPHGTDAATPDGDAAIPRGAQR